MALARGSRKASDFEDIAEGHDDDDDSSVGSLLDSKLRGDTSDSDEPPEIPGSPIRQVTR